MAIVTNNIPVAIPKLVLDFQLDEAHWLKLSENLKLKTLKKNEYFLKKGQICNYLGMVASGTLRTFYEDDLGNEISFLFYFDSDFFSDYESVLTGKPSEFYIQALEETHVYLLHKNDLDKLYKLEGYWQEFGRKIAEHLYLKAKKRVEDMLFLSPEKQYLKLLQTQPIISQKTPQKYIANFLGIKPQSLSRIRKRMLSH